MHLIAEHHYSQPTLECDFFELTAAKGAGTGESPSRFPVRPSDLVLADRCCSTGPGRRHMADCGGHAAVRVNTASRKQRRLRPETLEFARHVIVFTTFPEEEFDAASVLRWYRLRWQVELVFKRFKWIVASGSSTISTDGNLG